MQKTSLGWHKSVFQASVKSLGILAIFLLNGEAKTSDHDFFMTALEYGSLLYKEPRGISCKSCHGLVGKEALLYTYKHHGKLKKVIAPRINDMPLKAFEESIKMGDHLFMPKYDLTAQEIQAIYAYLQSKRSKP